MATRIQTRRSAKKETEVEMKKNSDEENLPSMSDDDVSSPRKRFKSSKPVEIVVSDVDTTNKEEIQLKTVEIKLQRLEILAEKPEKGESEIYLLTDGATRLGIELEDDVAVGIPIKITEFQIYDDKNNLVPMNAIGLWDKKKKSDPGKFFICGIAVPIHSDRDDCNVSEGISTVDLEITAPPWICGFGETDNLTIGVTTESFDIYLLNPHRSYDGMFEQYREKCYVAKRVADFFLKNADVPEIGYDDLLAYLQDPHYGTEEIDPDKLLEHGKFVCDHIIDFDEARDEDESSILENECFKDLCDLIGFKKLKGKSTRVVDGIRRRKKIEKKEPRKATTTPIVYEVFYGSLFQAVMGEANAKEPKGQEPSKKPKKQKSVAAAVSAKNEVADDSVILLTSDSVSFKNDVYHVGDGVYLPNSFFGSPATSKKNKSKYSSDDDDEVENLEEEDYDEDYNEDMYPEKYRKLLKAEGRRNAAVPPKPFCIGRIVEFLKPNGKKKLRVSLRKFYRPADTCLDKAEAKKKDWNLLYSSDELVELNFEDARGRCAIFPKTMIDEMKLTTKDYFDGGANRFYFEETFDPKTRKLSKKMPTGKDVTALATRRKEVLESTAYPSISKPLQTMDLFAGCGGMSHGLHQVGVAETRWAIENDEDAAEAFKLNNPRAQVFCEDANLLLKNAIEGNEKGTQKLPPVGAVEMIVGGPPCQGFSGLNRFSDRQAAQFKNSLIVTYLSYVERYRPKYAVFENVAKFASFGQGVVLRLTRECFNRLGYNVRDSVLQAGNFGVPQTRNRVIIVAAMKGYRLPNFPIPTHCFPVKKADAIGAPFPAVTVRDSISDLVGLSGKAVTDYKKPSSTHFQRLIRGGSEKLVDHQSRPLSDLNQARIELIPRKTNANWFDLPNIRVKLRNNTETELLEYIDVDVCGDKKTKELVRKKGVCLCQDEIKKSKCSKCGGKAGGRKCPVDKKPCDGEKDCVSQPNTLIPWCLPHTGDRFQHWSELFGRIDFDGYLGTMMTFPEPMNHQGRVLHPVEDRIYSIREGSRFQGFTDTYQFVGGFQSKHRQIGNAVPPPLAAAIGRELLKCLAEQNE